MLFALSLSALALSPVTQSAQFDTHARIIEALGPVDYSIQSLDPSASGRSALEIEHAGRRWIFDLVPFSNRSEQFQLRVQRADGTFESVVAPPSKTYRGSALSDPQVRIAASFVDGQWKAFVSGVGDSFFVQPLSTLVDGGNSNLHVVYSADGIDLGPDTCGTDALFVPPPIQPPAAPLGGPACVRVSEIAFDCDFEYFTQNGSTVMGTLDEVEAVVNAMNVVFQHDVLIRHEITEIIVRSAEPDPYPSDDPYQLLDDFRAEWNNNQGAVQRDHAHLLTGREVDTNIIGLAYVGVVCNQPWAYGWTQVNLGFGSAVAVLGHELGHNWNAPHCLDPACTLMCGACLDIGPITEDVMRTYALNAGCLDSEPGPADPIAPNAREDFAATTLQPIAIDVLANDWDGNCETVTLESFDATSAFGASITLSPGTGQNGNDELIYTPLAGAEGDDTFTYVAGDGSGETSIGTVSVDVSDGVASLVFHLKLNENNGQQCNDSSGFFNHGNYWGGALLNQPGAAPTTNSSVLFNGTGARARFPNDAPIERLRDDLTVSAWIKPDALGGVQRLFGNPNAWEAGFVGTSLRFTTRGIQDFDLAAGLQNGVWTHVAYTFDQNHDVRFYVNGNSVGTVFGSSQSGNPDGGWFLATHANQSEYFAGSIDDLQVYEGVLGPAHIRYLYENPGETTFGCLEPEDYCSAVANSVGLPAEIGSFGTPNLSMNNFGLDVVAAPPGQIGLFIFGQNQVSVPSGNGNLCVNGNLKRLYPAVTIDGATTGSYQIDFNAEPALGNLTAGSTWNFQFWFRDVPAGGAQYNWSDGLSVTFCP